MERSSFKTDRGLSPFAQSAQQKGTVPLSEIGFETGSSRTPGGWKRFSLRTLFVLMTVCCVLLGVWSIGVDPYRQQASSLALVKRLQGSYELLPEKGPTWQRWLVTTMVGPNSFTRVRSARLAGTAVDDETLASLEGLKFLRELNFDRTNISDDGCKVLRSFPELESVSLRFTNISDRAAAHLAELPQLKVLYLTSTPVSDASIEELAELQSLDQLFIRMTKITDAGAEELRESLPGCDVFHYTPLQP